MGKPPFPVVFLWFSYGFPPLTTNQSLRISRETPGPAMAPVGPVSARSLRAVPGAPAACRLRGPEPGALGSKGDLRVDLGVYLDVMGISDGF